MPVPAQSPGQLRPCPSGQLRLLRLLQQLRPPLPLPLQHLQHQPPPQTRGARLRLELAPAPALMTLVLLALALVLEAVHPLARHK